MTSNEDLSKAQKEGAKRGKAKRKRLERKKKGSLTKRQVEFSAAIKNMKSREVVDAIRDIDQSKAYVDVRKVEKVFLKSGVYFLFKDKKVVYIGESHCVISRVSQHTQEGIKEFDEFRLIYIEGERDREKEEKKMIRKFRPVYNYTFNKNVTG